MAKILADFLKRIVLFKNDIDYMKTPLYLRFSKNFPNNLVLSMHAKAFESDKYFEKKNPFYIRKASIKKVAYQKNVFLVSSRFTEIYWNFFY